MLPAVSSVQLDVVRGRLDAALEEEILAFWAAHAGFDGPPARARLPEVVCLARADGEIAGVCTVFTGLLEPLGERPFWIYRNFLLSSVADQRPAMIARTFALLDEQHQPGRGEPVGLCVLATADDWRARPEVEWHDPWLVYGGYARDGRQRRIAYFTAEADHSTKPEREDGRWLPGDDSEILFYADQSRIGADDLIAFWSGAGAMPAEEAARRVDEVLLVGVSPANAIVGIATVYLAHSELLGSDVWFFRTFVSDASRRSNLATAFVLTARDHLSQRFAGGVDRRGSAMVMEVENEGLKRAFPRGYWVTTGFHLLGISARGAHVRVHWFPGALAPGPQSGST